jgi:hypothetical protein
MSDKHMILWDFDGTLGHRPGMWGRAVLDVLQARFPDYAVTLAPMLAWDVLLMKLRASPFWLTRNISRQTSGSCTRMSFPRLKP